MSLRNDIELANTREKLRRLQRRYDQLNAETSEDDRVRLLTMESLADTIKQFKEEILRYECGQQSGGKTRRVLNADELSITRTKLRELEEILRSVVRDDDGDEELRDASERSLMKQINRLKEEIIWTEAHQPTRGAGTRS